MACIRRGIPNDVAKSRRVVLPFNKTDRWMSRFGFFTHNGTSYAPEAAHEIFGWVRGNCSGMVHHVEYFKPNADGNEITVWEFFFKTEGDAALFKLRFC